METVLRVWRFSLVMILVYEASGEDFKVVLEKIARCDSHSSSLADISGLKVTKLNATSVMFRGKVELNYDVSQDTTMKMAIQKYSLGSWMTVPFSISPHNVCEFVKKDTYYFPMMQKSMNLPKQCPFSKGTYQMNNAIISIRKLPAYLPKGCFRIDTTFSSQQLKHPSCYSIIARVVSPGDITGSPCPNK